MHVLRAEKGYIIVGQDTDGSVTPQDLGMGGLVAKTRIAWQAPLARSEHGCRRKQFVGLLIGGRACCPKGADRRARSARDVGRAHAHDRTCDVQLLQSHPAPFDRAGAGAGGLDRMGERVEVSLADGRGAIAVIASPVFYDA